MRLTCLTGVRCMYGLTNERAENGKQHPHVNFDIFVPSVHRSMQTHSDSGASYPIEAMSIGRK